MTDIDPAALDRGLKKGAGERLLPCWRQAPGKRVGRASERRQCFCRPTLTGQGVLARQRQTWDQFVESVRQVRRGEHA